MDELVIFVMIFLNVTLLTMNLNMSNIRKILTILIVTFILFGLIINLFLR